MHGKWCAVRIIHSSVNGNSIEKRPSRNRRFYFFVKIFEITPKGGIFGIRFGIVIAVKER